MNFYLIQLNFELKFVHASHRGYLKIINLTWTRLFFSLTKSIQRDLGEIKRLLKESFLKRCTIWRFRSHRGVETPVTNFSPPPSTAVPIFRIILSSRSNSAAVKSRRSCCGWHINYLLSGEITSWYASSHKHGTAAAADNGCSGELYLSPVYATLFSLCTHV